MSKAAGKKRPLDSAEKAINVTKKKIKRPDVRAMRPWYLEQANQLRADARSQCRRSWHKSTSSARW